MTDLCRNLQTKRRSDYSTPVFLVDAFTRAWRNTGRPLSRELMRLQARGLYGVRDPEQFRRKARWVLVQAHLLGREYPELAVSCATGVACCASLRRSPAVVEQAIDVALHHAEAAYPHASSAVRQELAICSVAAHDLESQVLIGQMIHKLAPVLRPGPWGMTAAGWDYINAEHEREKSLWVRLGDWHHKLMHPPGPDDITLPGHSGPANFRPD